MCPALAVRAPPATGYFRNLPSPGYGQTVHITTGYCPSSIGSSLTLSRSRIFFTQWYHEAKRSRLEAIQRVAETLMNHLLGLLTYFRHQITSAVTEALKGSIQALKSAARCIRSFKNHRIRILFFLGRLDLHTQ